MTDGNNEDNNNNSSQNNSLIESGSPSPSSMSFIPTTLHTIPVVEEKPAISKQSILSNTVIEKRWVTKTELVRLIACAPFDHLFVWKNHRKRHR